jgi:hypothetical protein
VLDIAEAGCSVSTGAAAEASTFVMFSSVQQAGRKGGEVGNKKRLLRWW